MHRHQGEHERRECECEEHGEHMGYGQGETGGIWPGHMGMKGKMCWGHKHKHGMMGGMGMCPICAKMMGGMGMWPGHMGMMGGMGCPICGKMMGRMWPGHMGMMRKLGWGHKHRHGMMGGMGMCPICGKMATEEGEEEEGPYRGKGPVKRTDEQIKAEVEQVLTDDSWLDASNIQVSVQEGVVTLTGTVDSRDSKRRSEDLADEVSGVKDVQNSLQIHFGD